MSYEKQTWANGDIITAEKLNHMEDGIAGAGGSDNTEPKCSINIALGSGDTASQDNYFGIRHGVYPLDLLWSIHIGRYECSYIQEVVGPNVITNYYAFMVDSSKYDVVATNAVNCSLANNSIVAITDPTKDSSVDLTITRKA